MTPVIRQALDDARKHAPISASKQFCRHCGAPSPCHTDILREALEKEVNRGGVWLGKYLLFVTIGVLLGLKLIKVFHLGW